jgi:hypothetical protein
MNQLIFAIVFSLVMLAWTAHNLLSMRRSWRAYVAERDRILNDFIVHLRSGARR